MSEELKGLLCGQGSGVSFTEMATWLKVGAGVQVERKAVSQEPVVSAERSVSWGSVAEGAELMSSS